MIICYDLEDNIVAIFDSYKECAEWFNTTVKVIHCHICRSRKGKIDKKRHVKEKKWYRLYKLEEE